ncbi:hypothetical protein ACWDUM_19150 [Rhodococcus sp. NPDC003322]
MNTTDPTWITHQEALRQGQAELWQVLPTDDVAHARAHPDVIHALRVAAAAQAEAEDAVTAAVVAARRAGVSWAACGAALGMPAGHLEALFDEDMPDPALPGQDAALARLVADQR